MEYKGLIAGLGNPGSQYASTRHNMGFIVLDAISELAKSRKSMHFEQMEISGNFELFKITIAGANLLGAKPLTYMNLSGKAVAAICGKYQIAPADVVVVHDELDLPLGRIKFKKGGGNNGHRGLASIQECLNTPNFQRMRLGIGRPEFSSQVKDWVLEKFNSEELDIVNQVAQATIKGLDLFYRRGQGFATQYLHTFDPTAK
jgi:PTH1 family peptidyl-tRNA hydrolase